MRARHGTLLVASAAAAVSALAAYYRSSGPVPDSVAVSPPLAEPRSLLMAFEPNGAVGATDAPEFNPDLDFEAGAIHADAVDVPVPEQPRRLEPLTDAPPAQLPRVAEAQPINAHAAAAEQELQQLLAHELHHLDASQRKVWQEVLQGLSPREALEIIQIWKLTGGELPSPGSSGVELPQTAAISGNAGGRDALQRLAETNLRHAATPGYRRQEPAAHVATPGAVALPTRIDLSPGAERETHNPLHLRIVGPGFFALRRGDVPAWTRNGEFDLSAAGELIQRRPDGDWSFDPPVRLPAAARGVLIERDGRVLVKLDAPQAAPVDAGQILIANFLNPQHLQPLQDDLLTITTASGPAWTAAPATPGCGTLQQGALEMSNATAATETALQERWPGTPAPLHPLPTY